MLNAAAPWQVGGFCFSVCTHSSTGCLPFSSTVDSSIRCTERLHTQDVFLRRNSFRIFNFLNLKKIPGWRILAQCLGTQFRNPIFHIIEAQNVRAWRALRRNSNRYWHYCTFWRWRSPQCVSEFVNLLFYVGRGQNIVTQIWSHYLVPRLTPWNYEQVCSLAHLKHASFKKWR